MRVKGIAVLGLAVGFALSAASAKAATICANPGGTSGCLKVNDAIDEAAPGDTVVMAAGTYTGSALDLNGSPFGYIYIGYGKDGMKLVGSGAVIVDVELGTGNSTWDSIDVYSSFVTISNITIRNGGIGISVYYTSGFTATGVKVLGSNSDCFYLYYADFTTIKGSKCVAAGGYGIDSYYGDYLTATGNTFAQVDYGLYWYRGNNPNFSSNTVLNAYDYPIYVYGSSSGRGFIGGTFKFNKITDAYYDGIYLEYQSGVTVASNTFKQTDGDGIYLYYSEDAIVTKNTITNAYGDGIYVSGSAPQITSNTIKNTYGNGVYIEGAWTDADGAVISSNVITGYPGGDGIDNYGAHVTIQKNVINNVYEGIYSNDWNPRIISNTVTNTQSTGLYLYCSSCYGGVIQLNKVNNVGGGSDGMDIYANYAYGPLYLLTNTVNRANYDCYYLWGNVSSGDTSINAVGNKGFDCGYNTSYGSGFDLWGNTTYAGFNLANNFVQRVAGDGYHVAAWYATLDTNTSDAAGEDGFDVHSSYATLTNNKATNSNGVGFEFNYEDEWADWWYGCCNTVDGSTLTITGNIGTTGNAVGACLASTMANPLTPATVAAANSFGTPDNPNQCSSSEGYIGN